jgi:hypothetical protein
VEAQSGYVMMPELPGIGFEGKAHLYRENEGAQQLTGSIHALLVWGVNVESRRLRSQQA